MKTASLVLLAALCTGACTHPIEIVGNGDVRSDSGDNDCLLEDLPCEAVAITEYVETYRPNPRAGHEFVGWDNCLTPEGDACAFDVPSDLVIQFWLQTAPALVAKFAPLCEDAPADSFTAIQTAVFNDRGCNTSGCHSGAFAAGGMNLANGSSYDAIVDITARSGGGLKRVVPGDANNSYLYRKVAAKTEPGSFIISGRPMPLIGSGLSSNQLAALAAWIDAGAPRLGRADELNEVERLLGLCN